MHTSRFCSAYQFFVHVKLPTPERVLNEPKEREKKTNQAVRRKRKKTIAVQTNVKSHSSWRSAPLSAVLEKKIFDCSTPTL